MLEVELPGSGWVVADIAAELLFAREFEAEYDRPLMKTDNYPVPYTSAEIRAELARRLTAPHAG